MSSSVRRSWIARVCRPAVLVGAASLALVVGVYWYMALRPGTNPALVPAPPAILKAFGDEMASGDLVVNARAAVCSSNSMR